MRGIHRTLPSAVLLAILITGLALALSFQPSRADDDPYYGPDPVESPTPDPTVTAAQSYTLTIPGISRDVGPGDENFAAAAALLGVGALPPGFFAVASAGAGISALNPIPGICPINAQLGMTGAAAAVYAKTLPPEAIATAVLLYDTPAHAQAAAQLLAGALDCFVTQGVGAVVQGLVITSIAKTALPLTGLPGFAAGARLTAQAGTVIPVGVTLDAIYVVSGRYLFAIARAGVGTTFPPEETVALAQAGATLLPPQ